jgi:alpha-galactosidase
LVTPFFFIINWAVLLALSIGLILASGARAAVIVTPQEMAQKAQWVRQNLLSGNPPFSFIYDRQASGSLITSWNRAQANMPLSRGREEHVRTWTGGQLQVGCVAVDYGDYPMAEWTVYFKNIGTRSTPVLEEIQGLDLELTPGSGPEFLLHANQGDHCAAESYAPYTLTLGPSATAEFSPPGTGKSCDGPRGWPYYNLQMPGGGVILAIGWPGQWAASFVRDGGKKLRIKAGQQLTHLSLNPGEEIRTPLIGLFFWQGTDVMRAQNLWRHWYFAHEIPRVNDQAPGPFMAISGDSIAEVNEYISNGIKPDVLWRDADTKPYTWYPTAGGPHTGAEAWVNTGTWEVDTNSYPRGFGELSGAVHKLGMKFLLWFEPERVGHPGSWLATQHPEWLLSGNSSTAGAILNEGDLAAFHWLTNHINGMIKANGVDWYREDMNGAGPAPAWHNHDAPDRQGMTENLYIQGHLAYWDALLAMNTGLRIDSCASGGRRNDLETMRRAVPLWRSDYPQVGGRTMLAQSNQAFTYALSSWLPFQGTANMGFWEPYFYRSSFVTAFDNGGINTNNAAVQKRAYSEWKQLAPIMLNGDYYPLSPYSLTNTEWMAWQFDRPDTGEGYVQAFRRQDNDEAMRSFRLSGLVPAAQYELRNLDVNGIKKSSGKELMEQGLAVEIPSKPGAVIVTYRRL